MHKKINIKKSYIYHFCLLQILWDSDFCKACKKKEKNFFESLIACISGMAEGICFKFYMWPPLSGGHLHCKFSPIWIRHHRAMDA